MSSCPPTGEPQVTDVPANAPGAAGPATTRLVDRRDEPVAYTDVQETDARTALARALAEYVRQVEVVGLGGRAVKLAAVRDEWAEPDEKARYPYACVDAEGAQQYDSSGLQPKITPVTAVAQAGRHAYIIHQSNLTATLRLGVWCTDKEQRVAVCAALERAFWPVTFTSGFRLDMPHYFGARARFEARSGEYADAPDEALRGHFRVSFVLAAEGPVIRLERRPTMVVSAIVKAEGAQTT